MNQPPTQLVTGVLADREKLNAQLTQAWRERWGREEPVEVHPDAFKVQPTGNRLLVVVDPVPSQYGKIYLPESHMQSEQMGIATVMGAGDSAGLGTPYPGSAVPTGGVEQWLYRTIVTAQHVGIPIRLDFIRDASYVGSVLMIADRDVLGVLKE